MSVYDVTAGRITPMGRVCSLGKSVYKTAARPRTTRFQHRMRISFLRHFCMWIKSYNKWPGPVVIFRRPTPSVRPGVTEYR
jgi:hypothetical protein